MKLGIIPGYGGTQRLPRLVGKGIAMQLLLAGEMISAQEAHRIGLVNEVVPAAELISRAEAIAGEDHRQRAAGSPVHDGSGEQRHGDAAGGRALSGSCVVWRGLRDGR